MTTHYKITAEDGSSCSGGTGRWRKNRWRSVKGRTARREATGDERRTSDRVFQPIALSYVDKLQRENADDLAFYPLTTLEAALEAGHVISCSENGEAAGYLWFGAVRGGHDITIYQACVDYSARRRMLGWDMVRRLMDIGRAGAATGIRLKCASLAESNEFWQTIGFYCTRVTSGGIKRGRDLNHYRTDLQEGFFTLPLVLPSERPIDLAAYHSLKRNGVSMPSRFSRTHYAISAASPSEQDQMTDTTREPRTPR